MSLYDIFKETYGNRICKYLDKDLNLNIKIVPQMEIYKNLYTDESKFDCEQKIFTEKCQECDASIFRQDLPFWTGSINKQIMIVSQDPGKGLDLKIDNDQLICVFGLQDFCLQQEGRNQQQKQKAGRLKPYLEKLIGDTFLDDIYATDIVKCAFSTKPHLKHSDKLAFQTERKKEELSCKKFCFLEELRTVKPKILIALGRISEAAVRSVSTELEVLKFNENGQSESQFSLFKIKIQNEGPYLFVAAPHPNCRMKKVDRDNEAQKINTKIREYLQASTTKA